MHPALTVCDIFTLLLCLCVPRNVSVLLDLENKSDTAATECDKVDRLWFSISEHGKTPHVYGSNNYKKKKKVRAQTDRQIALLEKEELLTFSGISTQTNTHTHTHTHTHTG
jgi:hypothetical protein